MNNLCLINTHYLAICNNRKDVGRRTGGKVFSRKYIGDPQDRRNSLLIWKRIFLGTFCINTEVNIDGKHFLFSYAGRILIYFHSTARMQRIYFKGYYLCVLLHFHFHKHLNTNLIFLHMFKYGSLVIPRNQNSLLAVILFIYSLWCTFSSFSHSHNNWIMRSPVLLKDS